MTYINAKNPLSLNPDKTVGRRSQDDRWQFSLPTPEKSQGMTTPKGINKSSPMRAIVNGLPVGGMDKPFTIRRPVDPLSLARRSKKHHSVISLTGKHVNS